MRREEEEEEEEKHSIETTAQGAMVTFIETYSFSDSRLNSLLLRNPDLRAQNPIQSIVPALPICPTNALHRSLTAQALHHFLPLRTRLELFPYRLAIFQPRQSQDPARPAEPCLDQPVVRGLLAR